MSRTRVRRRRTLTVVAAMACLLVTGPVSRALAPRQEPAQAERVYVVRAGDTLWSIAERLSEGGDPRVLVDALATRNDVAQGAIVPGQSLVVPRIG